MFPSGERSKDVPGMTMMGTVKMRCFSKALSVRGAGTKASSTCSAAGKEDHNASVRPGTNGRE